MATSRRLAAVALAVVLALGAAACGNDDDSARTSPSVSSTSTEARSPTTRRTTTSTSTTTTSTTTTSPTTTAPPTTAPPATAPPTTAPPPAASATLRQGDGGPAVLQLQQRLIALGYWLGGADGVFGPGTHHAVVAIQKAAGLGRDGVVGPATRQALAAGVRPGARSGSGRVIEIDLQHQLLLSVRDGRVEEIFDTSTGSAPGSTPSGHWTVTRQIDGYRQSDLGLLYRPKYFYEGVAVHGYTSVPAYPASHGCVRVTYAAMDHIWAAGIMPLGTPVWVY